MTPSCARKRHPVLQILGTLALLSAAAAQALAADPTEQCIVGDRAIGCVSERAVIELTAARKDAAALKQSVQDKLASGQCRMFDYGARVQAVTAHGNERTQVRRHGEKTLYWIPASWARPVAECEGAQSAAALHQKLGLPDASSQPADADERISSRADARAPAELRWDDGDDYDDRYHDDRYDDDRDNDHRYRNEGYSDSDNRHDGDHDDGDQSVRDRGRRPPPTLSRPLPSSRYAHRSDPNRQ